MQPKKFDENNQVYLSIIIQLFPTEEQKSRINSFIYASNYIYDLTIDWCDNQYIKYMNDDSDYKLPSAYDLNKTLAKFRENDQIIKSIPLHTCREALYRGLDAYKRYLSGNANHPLKHLPNNMTMGFKTESETFYIENGYARMQGFINKSALGYKVGEIKCQDLGFTRKDKFYNVSLFIDNMENYFIYAVRIQDKIILPIPKSDVIGIDIGYRLDGSNTIVCSDGTRYCQPDTTHLQSRIKYFQSKLKPINECKSIKDKENLYKFQLAHKKLENVLDTFYHQSIANIVKKNPIAIVIEDKFAEDLKRSGKNNLINYGVTRGGKIQEIILYKAKLYNIPVYIASSDFKSSYICSNCGQIRQKDLKQSKVFKCENPHCSCEIDRDLNAAINLANLYRFSNQCFSYNDYIKEII